MKLDDLDDRLVPRLAARLRALVDGTGARTQQARARVQGALLQPDQRNPLRRLDDRYASSGPLALLRDVPQLGLLLVSAVFFAGAGVALARSGDQQRAESAQQQIDATAPIALGPEVGDRVDDYLAAARQRALLVSRESPDAEYTALVTFRQRLTPQQAHLALGELAVSKVVLHAKLPVAEVLPVAVDDLVPDVKKVYADFVKRKTVEAAEFRKLAQSIDARSKEEEQFKAFYLMAATQSSKEAAAYKGNCACIIAALVYGPAKALAALPAVPVVRAVEVGSRQRDDDTVQIRPLAPEQTGVVAKIETPTGGNGA